MVSVLGIDTGKVASQSLAYDLSNAVSTDYIHKNRLTSDLNGANQSTASAMVASQKLAYDLSNCVSSNFLWINQVVDYLGDDDKLAASQSLVKALSDYVLNNCMKKSEGGNFVPVSDVTSDFGSSTEKVASQYLANQLCTYI